MKIFFLRRMFRFFLIIIVFFLSFKNSSSQVTVTPASTLTLCPGGDYQKLGDIVISEGSKNDFSNGNSLTYAVGFADGTYFQFNPAATITMTMQDASGKATYTLISASSTSSTTTITFDYKQKANSIASFTISGIEIKAISSAPLTATTSLIRIASTNDQSQNGNDPGSGQKHGNLKTGNNISTFNVTGGGAYCSGTSGVSVGLSGSEAGINYSLYMGSIIPANLVGTFVGTGSPLNFNLQPAGVYSVQATSGGSCTKLMNGSATVAAAPSLKIYDLQSATTSYCLPATGVKLTLSNSDIGVNYLLYNNNVTLVQTYPGTGASLDLGLQTAGSYTVIAKDNGGCTQQMNGRISITSSVPPADKSIIGGSYCIGQNGAQVKLVTPQTGYGYSLFRTSDNVVVATQIITAAIPPDTIFFGLEPAGSYKVTAFDASNSNCSITLSGTATVVLSASAAAPTITSSSPSVCSGAATTLTAVGGAFNSYVWYKDAIVVAGANTNTYIANQNGFYQVQGINLIGCSSSISAGIAINSGVLPPSPTLSATAASICEGQSFTVKAGSNAAVNYEFYLDGTAIINQIQSGNFPEYTTQALNPGTHTFYVRIQNGSGCYSSFSQISVNILPSPTTLSFSKDIASNTICQHNPVKFTANALGATSYQFFVNNISAYIGNGTYITDSLPIGANQIYVIAKNVGGCTITSSVINIGVGLSPKTNLAAFPIYPLICQGSTSQIKIVKTQSGVNYSLYDSTNTQVGATIGGTGGDVLINTGNLYKTTKFSVLAFNPNTNCKDTLDSKPVVGVTVTAQVSASSPQSLICEGDTISLFGSISGAASFASWSSSGIKGRFIFTANSYNARYIPGADDITAGRVTLTLTTNDPDGPGPCLAIAIDVDVNINRKPVVFFSDAGADNYCFDAAPVDLTVFVSPKGGTFSGAGVAGSKFYPSLAGAGTHTISYTIIDSVSNCKNISNADIIVNKLPAIDFVGLSATYCKDTSNQVVKLIPINDDPNGSGVFYGFLGLTINGTFIPGVLAPGVYTINYKFTNSNGCTNIITKQVKISPIPKADFIADNFCVGKKVVFNDASTIDNTLGDKIIQWFWDFGDGDPTGNNFQNPIKYYAFPGTYIISLTVVSNNGCRSTVTGKVTIGEIATPSFTWSGGCEGGATYFSGNIISGIDTYKWDFGDPASGNLDTTSGTNVQHQYSTPGTYLVRLRIGNTKGCVNDIIKKVYVLPYITITRNKQYFEGFEQGSGGWVADNLLQDSLYSWKLKTPSASKQKIKKAYEGSNAWVTDYKPDTSYLPNENSYVYSPCFNISDLKKPIVSLYIFNSTEPFRDGAVMQVSIDGGKTWDRLGDLNSGLHWFNAGPILSNPGQQPAGAGAVGWSGTDSLWRRAVYNLDNYINASTLRFRIAFSSNGDNVLTQPFDGFAFDNVSITERDHIVLLEHFTNTANAESIAEDAVINDLVFNTNDEAIEVQYHTDFPGTGDPFFNSNPNDLSAKALFYGIPQTPRTVIDGSFTNIKLSNSPIMKTYFNTQKLSVPKYKIDVALSAGEKNIIAVSSKIKSTGISNDTLTVQYLLVEKSASIGNQNFRNIVRKIFPDVTGVKLFNSWIAGTEITMPIQNLFLNTNIVKDPKNLAIVVVVQNYATKEVYQCAYIELNFTPDVINGNEDEKLSGIYLYPNPAGEEVKIIIKNNNSDKLSWYLYDVLGNEKLNGKFNSSEENVINIKNINAGNYILKIIKNDASIKNARLVIVH